MKIAILNDTHAGTRNSSDIFIDNQRRFYEEVFFPYCKENGIKNVLHLGDYYDHRKYVNFKALSANRQHFLTPLRDSGMVMDIIPGNHDVFYKNTNDMCSLKELLGHFTSNVNIIMKPKVLDYDGCSVAVVPWINNENYAGSVKFIQNCKADILGGHFEIEGFDMHKGVPNPHGMNRDTFKRFELVMSGHFHTKSKQDNIMYLGSQMEFTWADAHDDKYFHVLDTDTRELTPVRNPITLFERIYYDDVKNSYEDAEVDCYADKFIKVVVVNKKDPFVFDRFIDRLQDVDIHELKIAETFEEFSGENVEDDKVSLEDTSELLDTYVDAVQTDLDSVRIKGIVRELYVEAQNHEIV
jgi:DNA repair exonuclease SbcCD nuclease subunit